MRAAGWVRDFSGTEVTRYTPFDTTRVPLEPAEYFDTEAPEPDRMNFDAAAPLHRRPKASGYNVLEHEVALHRKLAFPLVTLVMTLIAVPFAVTTGSAARCTASASASCWRSSTGRRSASSRRLARAA